MYPLSAYIGGFREDAGTVTLDASQPVRVCPPDITRAILYFSTGATLTAWLWPLSDLAHQPGCIVVGPNQTFQLSWYKDGILPTLEWWGMDSSSGIGPPTPLSANTQLTWMEVRWQPPTD